MDPGVAACILAAPPLARGLGDRVYEMSNAMMLRERAARCREMAKVYHPNVGAPLYKQANELDREAARVEREGVERRGNALFS